jgi:hypothetical protein
VSALVAAALIRGGIASGAAAGAGSGSGSASEQKANDLIQRGVDLRRSGDDQAAYPLLQEAHELSHSPRAAAQRGLCEQALGRWAEAETHITEALKATTDKWVKKSRPTLEQSLLAIKSHIARIEIVGDPLGADVLVNGAVVGRLPLAAPVRVGAGELEVELRAAGYVRTSKSLHVEGGQYQNVVLHAQVEGAAPATASTAAVGTGAGTPARAASTTSASTLAAAPPSSGSVDSSPAAADPAVPSAPRDDGGGRPGTVRLAAKWVAWGLGAAAGGVGIYGLVRQGDAASQFNAGCFVGPSGTEPIGTNPNKSQCESFQKWRDYGYRLELAGFIGAGVLGATGLILWLTEPKSTERSSASLGCAPSFMPSQAWMGCRLRF